MGTSWLQIAGRSAVNDERTTAAEPMPAGRLRGTPAIGKRL
jgi:hypothetical protein